MCAYERPGEVNARSVLGALGRLLDADRADVWLRAPERGDSASGWWWLSDGGAGHDEDQAMEAPDWRLRFRAMAMERAGELLDRDDLDKYEVSEFLDPRYAQLLLFPLVTDLGLIGMVTMRWRSEVDVAQTAMDVAHLALPFMRESVATAQGLEMDRVVRLMLEKTSDVVVVARADGALLYLNQAGRQLFGIDLEGVLTVSVWDHLGRGFNELYVAAGKAALQDSGAWTFEWPMDRNGTQTVVSVSVQAHRDGAGRAAFYTAIMRDVTASYESHHQLRRLVREKDEFVATVSHELRTPLTSVVGFASELNDRWSDFSDAERRELLQLVHTQANEVGDIVSDLLVAARIDNETLEIHATDLELREEVEQVLLVVNLDATIEGDAIARADSGRTRQIVRNLLTNAQKYGGDQVRVMIEQRPNRVVVAVCDDGPGVPPHEVERIFGAYERGAHDGSIGGIGLGLFISRTLAGLMGGELMYRRHGGETHFVLVLPSGEPAAVADTG